MPSSLPPPSAVLDLLPDAVCIVDADARFLFVNASFVRILGYASSDIIGRRAFEFLHPEDLAATLDQVDTIMSGKVQRHFRNRYIHKDGHLVDMQWSAKWHEEYGVRIAVGREVTQLRHAEQELERLASHDPLTGLPNRHCLHRELQSNMDHARASGCSLAVLYIDMDGFKAVNDRCGHEAGDILLQDVAKRLQQAVHPGHLAARIGGDEFVVLMGDCAEISVAREFAQSLCAKLSEPYFIATGEIRLGASIGIALFPDDADDPASLLAHADCDMYSVKRTRTR